MTGRAGQRPRPSTGGPATRLAAAPFPEHAVPKDSRQMSDSLTRTLTSPEEIRGYLAQLSTILGHLATVTAKERQVAVQHAAEAEIFLSYLGRLSATVRALGMKYGFAGFVSERLTSDLEIASGGSAFPTVGEIRRVEADVAEANDPANPPGEDLRAEMVDFILRHKRPPRELQFRQSQEAYRAILRNERLFGTRVEPTLVQMDQAASGNQRWLLHWGVWDSQLSQPTVYLMVLEDSGKAQGLRDQDVLAALRKACLTSSMSSLQLLTIATKLDEEFAPLHPKSLKRVVVGPLHSPRFGVVADALAPAIEHVRGDWRREWALGWTVEILRSRGTRKVRSGLFGERQLESFLIDPKDFAASRVGASETASKLLMPYDVFQALDLDEGSPLHDVPKHVVAPDGQVASHI